MGKRRSVWGLVGVLVTLVVAAPAPASALAAAQTATTYAPTNVTNDSATFNGYAATSTPASYYYFQYGPASDPDAYTTPQVGFTGSRTVSASVKGLSPETTYSYRLVVSGELVNSNAYGNTETFTTLAAPGTIATTGQATDVTPSTADLNGVANTTSPASSWYFEWGRTTAYGHQTPVQHIGRGFMLVAAKVTGLAAKTTYHFRLVVLQSGQPTAYGNDSAFKTQKPFGRARLTSRRLDVNDGVVAIRFRCTGARRAPCKGKVALSTRAGHRTVGCAGGRLSLAAPHAKTLDLRLRAACAEELSQAGNGRLSASLKVRFGTPQLTLQARVTLLRR